VIGYLAQDVLPVAPYLVVTSEEKLHPEDAELTTLYNTNLSPLFQVLVTAVKELDARLSALEAPALLATAAAEEPDAPRQRRRHP
jgi:hypothetical protein